MKVRVFPVAASCAVVLLLGLLAGCPNPSATGNGWLTVAIADNINARTLLPPISMDAASYTVIGVGPNGATFSESTNGDPVTVDALAFGSWTVTVNALNTSGTLIGQGQGTAIIHSGQTTALTVSVTPLGGLGTLNLSVSWPQSQVETPSIQASLTPSAGTDLSFAISGNQATCSNSAIPAGYYTLALQLLDNNLLVMGAVEVVRIVAKETTSGTFAFSNVNMPGGTVVVNITPAMANPIPVRIGGVLINLRAGTSATVTASVDDGTPDVVYVWYLNGVSQTTGSSYTFGSDLTPGYYRLDVTAFAAGGTRGGSATASFEVLPSTAMVIDDFVSYAVGSYPSVGGWYELWPGIGAQVVGDTSFNGNQSFRLDGYPWWVRSDGIDLPLSSVTALTYRVAVLVPSNGSTGARLGFFQRTGPVNSIDFNSIHVTPESGGNIAVVGLAQDHGGSAYDTGIRFERDTWYDIKVHIDYVAGTMSAWINGALVASGVPIEPESSSSSFFVATSWAPDGPVSTAYFDSVLIY